MNAVIRLLRYSSGIDDPALVLKYVGASSALGLAGFASPEFAVAADEVASGEASGDGGSGNG
jgi:hypothetical protein